MNSGGFFDINGLLHESQQIEQVLTNPGFWDNREKAQQIVSRLSEIKGIVGPYQKMTNEMLDYLEYFQMLKEENDEEHLLEFENEIVNFEKELVDNELKAKLNGKFDPCNAIVSINAGAGGTESCDWVSMLLRMYQRWADIRGYKTEMFDLLPGEEAGIKNTTFLIKGRNAFGFMKAEIGVHRLVRISPFDSNSRRHTSFASVAVSAELDDDIKIDIKEEELKIDTFRSSGAGGQHVNTTDSAVRITHIPSNIIVTCQSERSQHKNKATALRILKAKLYEKIENDKKAEQNKEYGEKQDIGWGSQIRSYVFTPYQMVKDHRTKTETGNVQAVMDGEIDLFIDSFLKWKK